MTRRQYLLIAGGVTLLFLAVCPGVLKGEVLRPYDILYEHPPFAQHRPDGWATPRNGALWDGAMANAAFDPLVREALFDGRVPAWNPYQGAGTPLMADGISAPFEIPKLLSLAVPVRQAPALMVWLRLMVATLGMVALLQRGLGLSNPAAVVGGFSYALAAPVFGQLSIPHGYPAVWAPLVALGAIVAARRADARGVLALALPVAALMLAGHPGTALPILALGGAAALWTTRRWPGLVAAGAGVLLGFGLAAPYLLPHVLFTNGSYQQMARSQVGFPFLELSRWRVWVGRPLTIVSPAAWTSSPVLLGWRRLGLDSFPESCLAMGATSLALAWTALRTRWQDGRVRAATIAGLVGLVVAFRLPLVSGVLGQPVIRNLNPNQFVQVFAVAAAVLVAVGVDAATRDPRANLVLRRAAVALAVVLTGGWTALYVAWPALIRFATRYADLSASFQADPVDTLLDARSGFAVRMAVQVVAFVMLAAVVARNRRRLTLGLGAIMLLEGAALWFMYHPSVPADEAPPPVPELAAARQLAGSNRVAGLGAHDLEPNAAAIFGLRDANVYGNVPFNVGRFEALIGFSHPSLHRLDGRAGEHRAAVDLLAVSVIVAGPGTAPLPGTELAVDGPVRLYTNPTAVPRVHLVGRYTREPDRDRALRLVGASSFDPSAEVILDRTPVPPPTAGRGEARLVDDRAERLAIETRASGPRVLVVADTMADGWTARLDGRPVPLLEADARVRAVAVPAGRHTVTMTYVAPGLRLGLLAGAASAVIAVLCLVVGRRARTDRSG